MKKIKTKIYEWLSIQRANNPGRLILGAILIFNILFFLISAGIISGMSLTGTEKMGFFEATFCTITMILDAGCIQFVVADIGQAGVAVVLTCLGIIVIGMISFTGAVVGYVTNYISGFIEGSKLGVNKLKMSGHNVILNWNTRASEIINDLLYCPDKQKVVVLTPARKEEIEKEISERLSDTIARENAALAKKCEAYPFFKRIFTKYSHRFKNNITVIVREGDVFSSKQLHDISLEKAKMIIILGNDINNTMCKFEHRELLDEHERGNSQTVKTLMQVSDITAADYSDDDQKIIVEITDDWTWDLVNKIIKCKQVDEKCNIVPVRVNKVLGQILSQFSVMPELNQVYKELFSNKGASFYSEARESEEETQFICKYLDEHKHAIPLTFMDSREKSYFYYSAASEKEIRQTSAIQKSDYTVALNTDYWIEQKNVIILGHNSKCLDIMQGFDAFREEWHYRDSDEEIVRIVVIDDEENLKKMNYYEGYPFVIETVPANIYDRDLICDTIDRFVSANKTDTSVLILSDDSALNEDIDANALANLVYVQDIINAKKEKDPNFDVGSIDVIVEIIDPKHHDIVNSYSVNNVVISNRYISKMIIQIGEKEALYDFYRDILTYDTGETEEYESKEIYAKKVTRLFNDIPEKCTADELIRAVYTASIDESLPSIKRNPTIPLGYVKPSGEMILFEGDQSNIEVNLEENDKLIVFSNH